MLFDEEEILALCEEMGIEVVENSKDNRIKLYGEPLTSEDFRLIFTNANYNEENVKMTKEQFIKLMTVIKERYYSLESIYDKFNDLFGDVGDKFIDDTSLFPIIKTISEIIGDNEYWIEWYIYEKEWGTKEDMEVTDVNDNVVPSETLEDLWELIQSSKEV